MREFSITSLTRRTSRLVDRSVWVVLSSVIVVSDTELEDHDHHPPSVLHRLVRAGISEERARTWITSGGARVGGELVTDPDFPAPPPARAVLHPA